MRRFVRIGHGEPEITAQTNVAGQDFNPSQNEIEEEINQEQEQEIADILGEYFLYLDDFEQSTEDSAAEYGELLDRLLEFERKYSLGRNDLIDMIGRVYDNKLNVRAAYQADKNIGNSIFLDIAWRSVG